eukprot:8803032-Alexandrium_andersonii.AAC.1
MTPTRTSGGSWWASWRGSVHRRRSLSAGPSAGHSSPLRPCPWGPSPSPSSGSCSWRPSRRTALPRARSTL